MTPRLKSVVKQIIPKFVLDKLCAVPTQLRIKKCRKFFKQAPEHPVWLGLDTLKLLQKEYPFPPEYGYVPRTLEQRGKQRAEKLLTLLSRTTNKANTFLELGCWDGMTCCSLQRLGKITTAIDNRTDGFDERAARQGVILLQMDAADLKFDDESFDIVFSYDAFEHFAEPESVLREAIRVVKPGGYIYLFFGPLYMSPMGLHAYRSITVPYCQFLFPREILEDFVSVRDLGLINFAQVNEWSIEDYRNLWNRYADRLKKITYCESRNLSHLGLIMQYSSCFKSKTHYFDNLIVSTIGVLFKKIR